jgi:hypothetical protein
MMYIATLKFQKGSYLAFVLSDESRESLLEMFPPTFSKVICHHVTIIFGVTAGQLLKYQNAHKKDPRVYVTGYVIGEGVECLTVMIGEDTRRRFGDGGIYHITMSVEPPAKPVDSNKLLKDQDSTKVVFETPLEISGQFELVK